MDKIETIDVNFKIKDEHIEKALFFIKNFVDKNKDIEDINSIKSVTYNSDRVNHYALFRDLETICEICNSNISNGDFVERNSNLLATLNELGNMDIDSVDDNDCIVPGKTRRLTLELKLVDKSI